MIEKTFIKEELIPFLKKTEEDRLKESLDCLRAGADSRLGLGSYNQGNTTRSSSLAGQAAQAKLTRDFIEEHRGEWEGK